jgi:hypothetical protein
MLGLQETHLQSRMILNLYSPKKYHKRRKRETNLRNKNQDHPQEADQNPKNQQVLRNLALLLKNQRRASLQRNEAHRSLLIRENLSEQGSERNLRAPKSEDTLRRKLYLTKTLPNLLIKKPKSKLKHNLKDQRENKARIIWTTVSRKL